LFAETELFEFSASGRFRGGICLHNGWIIIAEIVRRGFLWASALGTTILGIISEALTARFVLLAFSVLFTFCRVGFVVLLNSFNFGVFVCTALFPSSVTVLLRRRSARARSGSRLRCRRFHGLEEVPVAHSRNCF